MNMKWLGSATFSRFLDASNSYIYVDLSWDEYTSSELLEVKVLYCTNIKKKKFVNVGTTILWSETYVEEYSKNVNVE